RGSGSEHPERLQRVEHSSKTSGDCVPTLNLAGLLFCWRLKGPPGDHPAGRFFCSSSDSITHSSGLMSGRILMKTGSRRLPVLASEEYSTSHTRAGVTHTVAESSSGFSFIGRFIVSSFSSSDRIVLDLRSSKPVPTLPT